MGFPLTQQQRRVVENRGGALLVSAAAGSGKTRVLVERLLDRVTREKLDLDRFLVITYTKAAAAELRGRIAQELAERLAQSPGDRHLRRQANLVYRTQISTIHAFCATLLRESGHLLALSPDFRLCDEGEGAVLKARVLSEVLNRRYEGLEEGDSFCLLADTLGAGRDDSRLEEIVQDVFTRIQSHPHPDAWLAEQAACWRLPPGADGGDTPWGRLLRTEAARQAEHCRALLLRALELTQADAVLAQNYAPSLGESLAAVDTLLRRTGEGWDAVAACFPIPFPLPGRKKGVEDEDAAVRMKALRTRVKKQLEKLAERFDSSGAALGEELSQIAPVVEALSALVRDFSAAYGAEKRRRNLLDFSDLEHFALELLTGHGGEPNRLAELWSARFDEVMVDEFQDTNQVQNALFAALSDSGRKLFLVGDVKQSIYRFRLADPTIFLEKYESFRPWDQAEEGEERSAVLSLNFRSRPQVLEGCNDLFRALMTRQFGELDYTDDQALVPGADFPPGEDYALEVALLDLSFRKEESAQEREDKDLLEARWCARRVRRLLEVPLMVTEGDGQRPLEPSDVLILLRSPGAVLGHYLRAFGEEGVPLSAEGGQGLFETTEGNVALALLRLVDNPRQDVALLAALRSPVFGFTEEDLALLRADCPQGDLYTALEFAAGRGDTSCANFIKRLSSLRFGARDMTARQLVWHVYEATNLLGLFGAMEGGQLRRENLLELYRLASQMEDAGCRSLFQLLLRLDRLRETGRTFPAAAPRQAGGVSILSIHRSKGLEKPVVLVCGLGRQFNQDDQMRPVLFHSRLGFGPKGLDQSRMVEYPTLARRAVARQLDREQCAEELRLLYVAMTRAREKLILCLPLTEGVRALAQLGEELSVPPSPMTLEQQPSVGHWILLHLFTRPEAAFLRDLADLPPVVAEGLGPPWEIQWVQGEEFTHPARRQTGPAAAERSEEEPKEGAEALAARLAWVYPHLSATRIPSKLTATQIKGRVLDQEAAEESPPEPSRKTTPVYRPDFADQGRGLTAAQRGTALHLAMQYLPLDGEGTAQAVAAEVTRLVERGFLTPEQGRAVAPELLSAFLVSPLGRAAAAAKVCKREFKFSLLADARRYFPQVEEGDEVLLQGVIDCWFEDETGIQIIDFKSDRVAEGEAEAAGRRYIPQLEAYSHALSQILGKPVARRWLWFFACAQAVEVGTPDGTVDS